MSESDAAEWQAGDAATAKPHQHSRQRPMLQIGMLQISQGGRLGGIMAHGPAGPSA